MRPSKTPEAGLDCKCNKDQIEDMLPAIFVSHGSPMLALEDAPARDFLKALPGLLPERPRAILVISAHWERLRPALNAPERNETIHDFGGFPPALFQLTYPAPPSASLARRAAELLAAAGLPADIDTGRVGAPDRVVAGRGYSGGPAFGADPAGAGASRAPGRGFAAAA